jgi:hypothetical protein
MIGLYSPITEDGPDSHSESGPSGHVVPVMADINQAKSIHCRDSTQARDLFSRTK